MKYQYYSSEDFAADEFFQQWVLQPTPESVAFWNQWINQHPEKRETLEDAREMVLMLGFRDEQLPHARVQQLRKNIFEQIGENKSSYSWYWRGVAAVLVLLILTVAALLVTQPWDRKVVYATGYGERQEFVLPDSSVIILNANSQVYYDKFWSDQGAREVWIQGEAFFKISQIDTVLLEARLKKYKPFIVHTERMDIEVLGTQFNVHARKRKTSVTLNSGKVALRVHKPEGEENITMVPGEKITYDPEEKHLTKSWVAPEDETAWRYNKLVFDKTPLHEVAAVIEDYYGIQVVFENQQMHEREYVGSVTLDNVDALIKAISKLYNLEIERKGSVIIFKDKPAR